MDKQPLIGVVTVMYNCANVLKEFFDTLDCQTYKNIRLYIIDNHSTDGSLDLSYELAQNVKFECVWFPQTENKGVAAGNNIGIKAALDDNCQYVLLSNNDIVIDRDCIKNLYEGMIDMRASMAVPKIYFWNAGKMIWMAGGDFQYIQIATIHTGERCIDEGQFNVARYINYAPTCFMLIARDVYDKVGYMDENYFVYYDDTDFVWRAVKRNDYKLAYIPSAVMWHKVATSTGGVMSDFSIRYNHRNHVYFALKNASILQLLCFIPYLVYDYITKKLPRFTKQQRNLVLKSYREGVKVYLSNKNK